MGPGGWSSSAYVKKSDGTSGEKNSYSNDLNPPKN